MYKKHTTLFAFILLHLLLMNCSFSGNSGEDNTQEAYIWKNVRISGGGFVTGIVFHPAEPGLRYCRTDMGGAYRWNNEDKIWVPLLDWLSYDEMNLMGVESIAVDPSDPDKVYLACGTYTNPRTPDGAILWSDDRGASFNRTDVPFKFGGNENGRGNGERMSVDPNNGNILFLGTRNDGLWKSDDGARTWSKVNSFPDVTETFGEVPEGENPRWWRYRNAGSGIIFTVMDPESNTGNKSDIIFVGVSLMGRDNLYYSQDGGNSWEAIPGQPTQYRPTHGVLTPDGKLIVSYGSNPGPMPMQNGGVWKYNPVNGKWTDITPDTPEPDKGRGFGYAAVSADASNPQVFIASSYNRYEDKGGEELFKTTNGGKSWKPCLQEHSEFDYSKAPYCFHAGVHWMFDIEIDPFNPDHVMFTTGYGGHECFNFTNLDEGKKVTWENMSTGIEETVPLEILSPPEGAQVISAVGDYCGFAHYDLDKPVPGGCFENPHFGNTNGVACAELKPEMVVRVGINADKNPTTNIGYSLNGGSTWSPTSTMPEKNSGFGHIAVSADGSSWIWTPRRSKAYLTTDLGNTWKEIEELPENTRVIADRVNPQIYYGFNLWEGKIFISTDGGKIFKEDSLKSPVSIPEERSNRGDSRGGQDRLYASPGMEGDLWLAAFDGLYHSEDYGQNFVLMPEVDEIHAFGFGKKAKGRKNPALYLVGTVDGVRGIFRSVDFAKNWTRINDDDHEWGLILHVSGDPKKFGKVYVGTHGRGLIYGDPAE